MFKTKTKINNSGLKSGSSSSSDSSHHSHTSTSNRSGTPLHMRQFYPGQMPKDHSKSEDLDRPLRSGGYSLPGMERSKYEKQFDIDLSKVRIHKGEDADLYTEALKAQAFAYKEHIWLGAHASEYDRSLMGHELGHMIQNHPGIQLREATFWERRAWLSFFSHYLPRKFLNNYMDDTGNRITLTIQEMEDCNPIVSLLRSRAFRSALTRLQGAHGGVEFFEGTGWGGALTNGTLGNFTIHYAGILTVNPDKSWHFFGTMWFEDFWDFNTGGANRPVAAEIKVRFANLFLPGSPFPIDSMILPVFQRSGDARAWWGSAAPPVHVPDRAGTTGADIEVGAGGGEAATSPGGPDVEAGGGVGGGEFGAQSSEDINR
jgi:hypothetical protein